MGGVDDALTGPQQRRVAGWLRGTERSERYEFGCELHSAVVDPRVLAGSPGLPGDAARTLAGHPRGHTDQDEGVGGRDHRSVGQSGVGQPRPGPSRDVVQVRGCSLVAPSGAHHHQLGPGPCETRSRHGRDRARVDLVPPRWVVAEAVPGVVRDVRHDIEVSVVSRPHHDTCQHRHEACCSCTDGQDPPGTATPEGCRPTTGLQRDGQVRCIGVERCPGGLPEPVRNQLVDVRHGRLVHRAVVARFWVHRDASCPGWAGASRAESADRAWKSAFRTAPDEEPTTSAIESTPRSSR